MGPTLARCSQCSPVPFRVSLQQRRLFGQAFAEMLLLSDESAGTVQKCNGSMISDLQASKSYCLAAGHVCLTAFVARTLLTGLSMAAMLSTQLALLFCRSCSRWSCSSLRMRLSC